MKKRKRRKKRTHILLVGVEEPEGEVTGLGGSSELTQRAGVARQQEAEKE